MNLADIDMPLQSKQRLAARRTHEIRSNSTETRIKRAISELSIEGKMPTKTAVAGRVEMSRQQISRRYGHLFESETNTPTNMEAGNKKATVTLGVHQVTAALRDVGSDFKKEVVLTQFSKVVVLKGCIELKDEGD
jgi:hypothetical protein